MLSLRELEKYLEVAKEMIETAFLAVKKDLYSIRKVERDLRRDVKVVADKELESIIIDKLKEESPFAILSEERGVIDNKSDYHDYTWIVDPLDGSLNFSRGIPICCISIALWKGMEPLLGVVYDFNRNEVFTGLVGKGAWLNESPIKVSKISEKSKAIVCTGFPTGTDFSKKSLSEVIEAIKMYKKLRLLGSAALSLSYVASGRVDAYYEKDIKIWDVAGGLPILLGAGGRYEQGTGRKNNSLNIWATNGMIVFSDNIRNTEKR